MAYDLDRQPGAEPRVIFSPVQELAYAANLVHSADPALVGFDLDWRRRQREQLGPEAQDYLAFATGGLDWATLSLCDYLPISGEYDDWERFAARVLADPIDDFLFILLNKDLPFEDMPRLRHQPERAAGLMDRLSCYSRMSPTTAVRIFSDPEGFRTRLLAYVAGNRTPAFESRLAELRPRFEARMAWVRERLKGRDPIAVAEELARKPFRYARNFRTYTFAPSHFLGLKHLYAFGEGNFLFSFSLLRTDDQPSERARELSDRMKVLGDRTRLDILRLLSEGPSYGKAIADRLELTTATVSRQLDQLKEAGLVTEDRADSNNVKLVRLRSEAFGELFGQIQGFLGLPRP